MNFKMHPYSVTEHQPRMQRIVDIVAPDAKAAEVEARKQARELIDKKKRGTTHRELTYDRFELYSEAGQLIAKFKPRDLDKRQRISQPVIPVLP